MAVGFKGTKEDIVIRKGANFGPYIGTVKNPDGTPYDLTDVELKAVVCRSWGQAVPTMVINVVVIDAINGKFSMDASWELTDQLECGDTEQNPKSQYFWQLDAFCPNDRKIPLVYGTAFVFRRLTDVF